MTPTVELGLGLLAGAAVGAVVHRGDFSMYAAFLEARERRFGPSLRAWLLALAAQALVVNALAGSDVLATPVRRVAPALAVAGGLLLGAGMVLSRGCALAILARLGTGSAGSGLAVIGAGLGAAVAALVTASLPDPRPGGPVRVPEVLGMSPVLGLAVAVVAAVPLAVTRPITAAPRRWSWQATGLALGGLGVVAWGLGAAAGWPWGLSTAEPARALLLAAMLERSEPMNFGVGLLAGVPAGAWASARRWGPVRWRSPGGGELTLRFAGGVLTGAGGGLAGGCVVAGAITNLAVLSIAASIATVSAIAGAAVAAALLGDRARVGVRRLPVVRPRL